MPSAPGKALAIDASAWFHDPALRGHLHPRHWRRLPPRLAEAARATLAECARHGVRATWFVPGELAAATPGLVRELATAGHELMFAANAAAPLATLPAAELERVLRSWSRGLRILEAASGMALHGCRSAWIEDTGAAPWRAWCEREGFRHDATRPGADVVPFAAWRFDAGAPRLAGLPPAVYAAHYDQLRDVEAAFAAVVALARAPIGGGQPSPPNVAPARPAVPDEPRPDVRTGAPRFAIVVPLKDEATGIASLALELDALARDLADVAACEFVFVDDGSTDRTWALLQENFADRPGCTLVQHPQNRGVAAAIHTGLAATDAAVCASIDGDLSYDPRELRAMLAQLEVERADVVTASPYHPDGGVRNVPGWRLLLSRTLSAVYRRLLRSPLHTWTACFRVYRRAAVAGLPVAHPGFLGTAELLVRVLRRGGRVVEHPCVLEARLFGFSKMKVLRTIRQHLGLLWQVARGRIS
ncbi:MAG: glycosyltransferase [Planctomycetes bacterium]|nr:glycosyltransferase [Planctomycetota bacterium]